MNLPEQPTIDYIAMSGEEIEAAWEIYYRQCNEYFASLEPRRRAHTRRNSIAGLAAAKRAALRERGEHPLPMTKERLAYEYGGYVVASKKKKGADKGYKNVYAFEFDDEQGYYDRLRELDPSYYAIVRINRLYGEIMAELPRITDEAKRRKYLSVYRRRVTAIRKEYGLRSCDVAEYMRVN